MGHPFDTIKVRLQTTDAGRFGGPLDCVAQTLRREGVRGLYKGATPPLVGWMVMDSVMLGSLTLYRRLLAQHFVADGGRLPAAGHGLAGTLAGATVSLVAAPVEHVKARLQVQYGADRAQRRYQGPVDCARQIYRHHGLRGIYHGLAATLLFRSFFFVWWASYDVISRALAASTALGPPAVGFWAGGLSAQLFWLASYPSDVVKQRIMTDALGGGLRDGQPRYASWAAAARALYAENGVRAFWRGFVPCFARAFPANAVALAAFEGAMRALP